MMTTTEILKEIRKLPSNEQANIKKNLFDIGEENLDNNLWKKLFDEGLITHIPSEMTDEDEDFEPIEIEGEPISEMIIRERR